MRTVICTIFILSLSFQLLNAQDKQQAWQTYMTPGKEHTMLAESAGEWNTEISMWTDPAQPPQKSEVSCTMEMIMGGRYLKSTQKGTIMGMPFEGMMLIGYDNTKKVYTSVWYDDFGTGTTIATGTYNSQDSTLNFIGTMVDPATGNDIKYRETMKCLDKDNQVMTMYITQGDKEVKNMDLVFTRKK
jgi:hypothetical protein